MALASASNLTDGPNDHATFLRLYPSLSIAPGLKIYDSNTAGFLFACSTSSYSTWPCSMISLHDNLSPAYELCSTYSDLPIFTHEPERFGLIAHDGETTHVYEAKPALAVLSGCRIFCESFGRSHSVVDANSSCFVTVRDIWLPKSPDEKSSAPFTISPGQVRHEANMRISSERPWPVVPGSPDACIRALELRERGRAIFQEVV